jgi:hypothetical protein
MTISLIGIEGIKVDVDKEIIYDMSKYVRGYVDQGDECISLPETHTRDIVLIQKYIKFYGKRCMLKNFREAYDYLLMLRLVTNKILHSYWEHQDDYQKIFKEKRIIKPNEIADVDINLYDMIIENNCSTIRRGHKHLYLNRFDRSFMHAVEKHVISFMDLFKLLKVVDSHPLSDLVYGYSAYKLGILVQGVKKIHYKLKFPDIDKIYKIIQSSVV